MSNIQGPKGFAGTEIAWRDEKDAFEIMSWTGYNPELDTFTGTITHWTIDSETEEIHLLRVGLRFPYRGWRYDYSNSSALVPDSHKRKAREVGRERFGKTQFRKLVL